MNGWAHDWLPHTEQAVYAFTMASALTFGVMATIVSYMTVGQFQPMHTIMQAGSGAMLPVFITLPFVPFDDHLIVALRAGWITVGLSGLLGIGVIFYALFYTNNRAAGPYDPPGRRKPKPKPTPPAASTPPMPG